jgi:hypothetical protein
VNDVDGYDWYVSWVMMGPLYCEFINTIIGNVGYVLWAGHQCNRLSGKMCQLERLFRKMVQLERLFRKMVHY